MSLDAENRCCQTNANWSQFTLKCNISGRTELPPFNKRCGAVQLEVLAAVKVTFLIEMVVDGRVNGGELLQTSHSSETLHRSLSSSQWLMGILDPVVEPSAGLLALGHPSVRERGVI